jgi:hypothetical protein
MADLRISEASQEALRARLASPEGKEALSNLARLIAKTAIDAMPPDLLATLDTPEGMKAFLEAWPDLVSAFLFRGSDWTPARGRAKKSRKKPDRVRSAVER